MSELKKTTLEFDGALFISDVEKALELTWNTIADRFCFSPGLATVGFNGWCERPSMALLMTLCERAKLNPGNYFYFVDWVGTTHDRSSDGTG